MLVGDRGPAGGSYSVPNIDINYGIGSRIQLKYEAPLGIQESQGTRQSGCGRPRKLIARG